MKHQFSPRHSAIIAVIKEAREAARLTQRELSSRLQRASNFIAKVEIGERGVSYAEGIDIAIAIGIDPHDMLDKVLTYYDTPPALETVVVSAKKRARKK